MPATTTTLKIPYPLPGDRVADYPTTAKTAAQTIEANITSKAQLTTPSGWTWRANSATVQKVGRAVLFSGADYSANSSKTLNKGSLVELGTIIPSGYRPNNEVHIPTYIMNGWGNHIPCVLGIRSSGTAFVIPGATVTLSTNNQYYVLIMPPATWSIA